MSRSLLVTLRRRLILVGLALTAASLAVVTFYYLDWPAMRGEEARRSGGKARRRRAARRDGQLGLSLSPRHERIFADHPHAYAYRIEDENGTVVREANGNLIPPQLSAASLPAHLVKATSNRLRPNGSMATIHRVSVAERRPM